MSVRPEDLSCWRCGANLKDVLLPFARLAECPECRAELHVCLMCVHFDRRYTGLCRHDLADKVLDKERANFCGYLRPCRDAHARRKEAAGGSSRSDLDALFGDPAAKAAQPTAEEKPDHEVRRDRARAELEQLFGADEKGS